MIQYSPSTTVSRENTAVSSYATSAPLVPLLLFHTTVITACCHRDISALPLANESHWRTSLSDLPFRHHLAIDPDALDTTVHTPYPDARYHPVALSIFSRKDGRQRNPETPPTATQLALDQGSYCKSSRHAISRAHSLWRMLALPNAAM